MASVGTRGGAEEMPAMRKAGAGNEAESDHGGHEAAREVTDGLNAPRPARVMNGEAKGLARHAGIDPARLPAPWPPTPAAKSVDASPSRSGGRLLPNDDAAEHSWILRGRQCSPAAEAVHAEFGLCAARLPGVGGAVIQPTRPSANYEYTPYLGSYATEKGPDRHRSGPFSSPAP